MAAPGVAVNAGNFNFKNYFIIKGNNMFLSQNLQNLKFGNQKSSVYKT